MIMIRSFKNIATEDIFNGINSKDARNICPISLWRIARRKLEQIDSTNLLSDLRVPPGNNLEQLGEERKGQYSIRINDKYRVCFRWVDNFPEDVEIIDYH
jgi:proteic killer suppression protein